MKINKYLLCAVAIVMGAFTAFAQNTTSPYSMFGYGLLNDNATSAQRNMGGVGYAMSGGRQINAMNPASYAAIDSLTFLWDIGADVSMMSAKEGSTKSNSTGGGLDYITMQFPLCKIVGASIGLVPYSSVGYSFGGSIESGSVGRTGTGGLNQLYGGVSVRPFKGFSIGANVGYLFGTTIYDNYVYSTSTSLYERVMQVRSWNAQFGMQYSHKIGKDKVTLGVVYSPKKSLHGNTWGAYYDMTNDTKQDTIGLTKLKGNNYTPNCYGVGLSYEFGKKLITEVDFTYQEWSKADYTKIQGFDSDKELKFDNRWKVAAGLQYTPDVRGSYLKRVNYRFGGYFNHDYMKVQGNNVREYGLSCGFGLPTPSTKTVVNIGFEYKHRESSPVTLITENYFNITVGVNFNELWFWKSKIR